MRTFVCPLVVVTIPRIIIRDLGDHADKRELVEIYSKFNSFKNVWVANNPPGFAYVFFDNMKDAVKAVASTNGRTLCGGRVRVELTPIDEKPEFKHQTSQRGRLSQRSMATHNSPGYRPKRPYRSPDASRSPPPVPRDKFDKYSSSLQPPLPKRRTSFGNRQYDQGIGGSPTQGKVHRRSGFPRNQYERREKMGRDRDTEFHYEESSSSTSSRPGKVYRETGFFRDRERYRGNNDRHMIESSSPSPPPTMSPVAHRREYFGEHGYGQKLDHGFDGYSQRYSGHSSQQAGRSKPINHDDFRGQLPRKRGKGREECYEYLSGSPQSSSPPPPVHHPRSSGKRNASGYKFKGHGNQQKSWESDVNPRQMYEIHHDVTYTYVSSSPSPSSPPPPLPSHRKSRYDQIQSRQHHSQPMKRKERVSSESRHHRHRDTRSSQKICQHRSRSPIYHKDGDHYATSGSSPQLEDYQYIEEPAQDSYQKQLSDSPPRLKGHQYYEQIEDGAEAFFSEAGYHSNQPSPQYIQNTENIVVDYSKQRSHPEMYRGEGGGGGTGDGNLFEYHQLPEGRGRYEGEPVMEQYLQIDEVKESNERGEYSSYSQQEQHHSYHQEREVVYSDLQKKEREVLHRKHEREVVVKRSPSERNRFVCL